MKTMIFAVLMTVGAVALSAAEVESANAVGVLDVSVAAGRPNLVAVPFAGYEGGAVTVADIVKTSGLGAGTELMAVAKDGSKVNSWRLSASGEWETATDVTLGQDGTSSQANGADSAATSIARGDAFWLKPMTAGKAYVLGQQASGSATVSTSAGWNIVGNPNITSTTISSAIQNPADGDEIVVDNNGFQKHYTYVSSMEGWCHINKGQLEKVDVSLEEGKGCWLHVNSSKTINW